MTYTDPRAAHAAACIVVAAAFGCFVIGCLVLAVVGAGIWR